MAVDELEPLIPSESRSVAYNVSSQEIMTPHSSSRNSIEEVTLIISPKQKSYGSFGGGEKVTYTWADVNAFATESRSRSRRLCPFWRNSSDALYQQRKQLLKSVNGAAYPGELLAIMGSSGAGKTTLLNTLTFRTPSGVVANGTRALNGQPATPDAIAALSAYVQQQDLFIGTLTVREHLIFQALVRMDREIPYTQRMHRVQEVISELALTKCQNTMIGIPGRLKGISGGEMKRLSFASEVLTDPPLMFCDEPTSGLDSFMAQNVLQVLKGLAQKGKTVVCTIHQPSSELYAMFDKLLIMAEGRVAFLGSPDQATEFFRELGAACPANYNPADHFIQILAGVPGREDATRHTIDTVCTAFSKSELGCRIQAEAENALMHRHKLSEEWAEETRVNISSAHRSPYKASWWAQFRAVLWRSWLSVTKEPMLIKVRFLQTIMVSILIGIIYFGQHLDQDGVMNINGAIFMFLTNMTFQNIFAVINVFCSELPIFIREHQSGMYRADVYFLSKTLAEAPVFATIPLVFTVIAYYMIGLNPAPERFFIASGLAALITNVATSFGYLISCASSSVSMAASVGPPIIIPFMLFGGFFLNSGSVPPYLGWISYLSWFRYGNEALLVNQWSGVDKIACTRENFTCPASGQVVLDTLSFSEDDFTMDVVNMILLFIGFRLLAYIALVLRARRPK